MMTQNNSGPAVSSKALKNAIQSLRPIMGSSFVSSVIHDLESHGFLPEKETFMFEEINKRFESVFGEAAPLLMRILASALFEKK